MYLLFKSNWLHQLKLNYLVKLSFKLIKSKYLKKKDWKNSNLNNKNFSYYFQAAASKQSGGLSIKINGKMFQTSLTSQVSSNVQNEKQEISIISTIVPESYVILILKDI